MVDEVGQETASRQGRSDSDPAHPLSTAALAVGIFGPRGVAKVALSLARGKKATTSARPSRSATGGARKSTWYARRVNPKRAGGGL
jgi:hypothetical protein